MLILNLCALFLCQDGRVEMKKLACLRFGCPRQSVWLVHKGRGMLWGGAGFLSPRDCEKIVLFLGFSSGSMFPYALAALFDARRAEFSRQAGTRFRTKRLETADF